MNTRAALYQGVAADRYENTPELLAKNRVALPLPSTVVNAYQGLLPTYLYAFQFPVNTAARPATPLVSPIPLALTLALGLTCLVVAYSASVWRSSDCRL